MTLRVPIVDLWGPDQPSILPWTPFNSEQDAKDLHETIHGLGTQDNKIISILAKRTVSQRKEIASSYETLFQNTLEGDLERSLSGNLKNVVLNSLQYLPEMKAIAIHNALKVAGTLEQVLIQTLAVATNNEIKQIKEAYSRVFNSDLETDVGKKIYGEFKALILVILKAERNESRVVDGARVANDAFMINKLGSTQYGTEERVLAKVLTTRSFNHIKLLAPYFKKKYLIMLNRYIIYALSGDYSRTLLSIVKFAVDPTDLYANWIYDAIKAPGADNEDLIRLILSRAEINLQNIKDAYRAISEKTLIEDIEEVTSGDYKNMLVALVNGNFEELQDCKTENS